MCIFISAVSIIHAISREDLLTLNPMPKSILQKNEFERREPTASRRQNANRSLACKEHGEAAKIKAGGKQLTKSPKKKKKRNYIANSINISRLVGKAGLILANKVLACIGKTVSNIKLPTTGSYPQNFIPKNLQM